MLASVAGRRYRDHPGISRGGRDSVSGVSGRFRLYWDRNTAGSASNQQQSEMDGKAHGVPAQSCGQR